MTGSSNYWLAALAIAALVILALIVLRSRLKARAVFQAELNAQIARESDELDLDRRLGEKQALELQSIYGDAVSITVRQSGLGPDILCLHGIGASMLIYRRLAPQLAAEYRLTCLDFPGFGASAKPRRFLYTLDEQAAHLVLAVEALKLERPLLVASSMGGAIAMKATIDRPDLFRGVVALAPAVDPRRVPTLLLPLAKHADRFHRMSSLATTRAVVQAVISRRELITPALVALYQEPFRDEGDSSSAFMKAFALLADARMPALFRDMTTPLLIIRGLRDRLVKQAGCEDLHRVVKNSKLITHVSAGHHIMEDEPEFVAQEIRKFDSEIS